MTQPVSGQHRDPLVGSAVALAENDRPTPGPLALLPQATPTFVEAIASGGGTVADLSADTRGVIWLADSDSTALVDVLESHPGIEWVQLPWAGVEPFRDVFTRFAARKLLWTSAKGAYSEPVAEHALALTLATLRQLPQKARGATWARPKQGISLYGLNVVIVGAGGVALETIRLLSMFGVHVTVVRRSSDAVAGAERTVSSDQLGSVLPDADVVVIAAASTRETRHLIGAAELASMKPTAVLVNVARGALVDSDALLVALREERLYGAGLDVTDPEPLPDGHPLWSEPRCIVTSHTADTPDMTAPLLAARIRQNTAAFVAANGKFVGIVDTEAGY